MKTIFIGSFVLNLQCHKICRAHLLCSNRDMGGRVTPIGYGKGYIFFTKGHLRSDPHLLICFNDSPSKLMKSAFYFILFLGVAKGIWRYFLVS